MAEQSRPWVSTDDTKRFVSETQHRAYLGGFSGTGVINARTASALDVVADGTTTLRLQPGEYVVDGMYYRNDSVKTIDVAASEWGAAPPQGQSRLDYLVMRLNPATKDISAVVKAGLPAANPSWPTLSRPGSYADNSTVYEEAIRSWRWTGTGLTQEQVIDRRGFIGGPPLWLPEGADLPPATVGTRARRGSVEWVCQLVRNTQGNLVPGWVNQFAPVQGVIDWGRGFRAAGANGFQAPYVDLDVTGYATLHGEFAGGVPSVNGVPQLNAGATILYVAPEFAPTRAEMFTLGLVDTQNPYPAKTILASMQRAPDGRGELIFRTGGVTGGFSRVTLAQVRYRVAA